MPHVFEYIADALADVHVLYYYYFISLLTWLFVKTFSLVPKFVGQQS